MQNCNTLTGFTCLFLLSLILCIIVLLSSNSCGIVDTWWNASNLSVNVAEFIHTDPIWMKITIQIANNNDIFDVIIKHTTNRCYFTC